jgi:hypothetical protein
MFYQPRRLLRLTSWSGQDKRLSIPTNIWLYEVTKLAPVPDGTRVTTTCRGESRGFFKLAEPLVVRLSKRLWENGAENLRTLMEDHAL